MGGGRRKTAALLAAFTLVGLAWAGCSVEKHYKVLSFFFDGVPSPEEIKRREERQATLQESPTYVVHKPVEERKCQECHTRNQVTLLDSSICLKCHEGKKEEYEFMHGPVAAGACLWCHDPHESAFPALLLREPRSVCVQCHAPGMLDVTRVPEHADASRSCLECHSGHGGPVRFFLRTPDAGGVERGN